MKPSLIILDRDGVLNELWCNPETGKTDSPASAGQVRLTSGAVAAVRRIKAAGLPCAVASNQPGIAKGKLTFEALREVTAAVICALVADGAEIDRTFYCLHHPAAVIPSLRADCPNRKPRPGLLLHAARHFAVEPNACWFIGDMATDVAAGRAAGCGTAWIGPGAFPGGPECPDIEAHGVMEAVTTILEGRSDAAFLG
jgi:D-glycero-D-manno-heptose 1,7-bisphosphate phosphatase